MILALLQEADPSLLAKACECSLTLRDPIVNKKFPRQVALINLGAEVIKPAELQPKVTESAVQHKVLWIQAWKSECLETWNQIVTGSAKEARQSVLQCIAVIFSRIHIYIYIYYIHYIYIYPPGI